VKSVVWMVVQKVQFAKLNAEPLTRRPAWILMVVFEVRSVVKVGRFRGSQVDETTDRFSTPAKMQLLYTGLSVGLTLRKEMNFFFPSTKNICPLSGKKNERKKVGKSRCAKFTVKKASFRERFYNILFPIMASSNS